MPAPKTIIVKKLFYKRTWVIIVGVVLLLIIIRIVYKHAHPVAATTIPVTQGSITQTVSVTGNSTPISSVSLGFQNSGTVASVNYDVGDHVFAGAVIASLNCLPFRKTSPDFGN